MSNKYDFETVDGIRAIVGSLARRGESLQQDYHKTAIAIAALWARTGDYRDPVDLLNELIEALPGSVRSNAMRDWAAAYLPVAYNTTEKKFVVGKDKGAKALSHKDKAGKSGLDAARENPFWQFKPEPEYKPFDFPAELAKLLARADKRLKEGVSTEKGDNLSPEALAAMKEAAKTAFTPTVAVPETPTTPTRG